MKENRYLCEKCGSRKSLFIERALSRLFITLGLLTVFLFAALYMEECLLKPILGPIGFAAALSPAISLLRIRCLACEPEWKARMWGNRQRIRVRLTGGGDGGGDGGQVFC
jgi:hypothetical protein